MSLAILNPTTLTVFAITVLILSVVNPKPFIAIWEWFKEAWSTLHDKDKLTAKVFLYFALVVAVWAYFEFI